VVYLNGRFVPIEDAKISVLDRGFIFGDGVYEVVPVYRRRPYRVRQHFERLQYSLDGIHLANPHSLAEWEKLVAELVARQEFEDQSVYIQVTRGPAKRDHVFPAEARQTVFMMSTPLVTPPREQVDNGVACITAEDNRWLRCDLKTTSLVGNVLLRNHAAEHGAIEAVLFRDGFLTEASASNVVTVRNGIVVAPPKNNLILPGITYGAVYDLAIEGGLPFEMRPVTREETLSAEELWLTSSTKEVLAVTRLDGRPIGGGRPGPMFRRMWELFQESKARL